jgi:hypothetical protein
MGKFIRDTTAVVGEKKLIDVGSGVGHLARYLSYAHHLQATNLYNYLTKYLSLSI